MNVAVLQFIYALIVLNMERKCLFDPREKGSCDIYGLHRLVDCDNDISGHLNACHLSHMIGSIKEFELILNRAGLFDVSPGQIENFWVCQRHRENMGRKWRAPKTCQYPLHSGPRKKLKNRNVVNKDINRQVRILHGVNVSIGSPICVSCVKEHNKQVEENKSWIGLDNNKEDVTRLAKRVAEINLAACIPSISPSTPSVAHSKAEIEAGEWTPGCCLSREKGGSESSLEDEEKDNSVLSVFNSAMCKLSQEATNAPSFSPLTFQLQKTWEEANESEKKMCIEKATEACGIICDIIAPNAGQHLFHSCLGFQRGADVQELIPLMEAYRNASTKNVKTQILSLYAYRYPANVLQKMHEPYAKLTEWQIKRARAHAKQCGPGSLLEKSPSHRVRLPAAKVDHFVDFINRPYFYQDVAFGTRKLKLESGEKIIMPNVIRKVTRSTMVKQYMKFCEEDQFQPLSRATLYRVLDVTEASQQKSMSGLDNIASEGSASFDRLKKIVEEVSSLGLEKATSEKLKTSLIEGKRYFKTEYQCHCQEVESQCPDHCRKFALSDPADSDLVEKCKHKHLERCNQCENVTSCLREIKKVIKDGSTLTFYSKEQQGDLLYDVEKATESIFQWKAHIIRTVNQECAKQDQLHKLDSSSCLIVMDWAMKFLQLRFREKQADWYGKRGLSWHISSVVSLDEASGSLEVMSYAHLIERCTQDWYAVTSIIEDLLAYLKKKNPKLQTVYLRSDEAGCYHNSSLIAALRDVGKRVGVVVANYHYSEPQAGKDICDRILCPMKSSIRTYCNEGHDILTANDMREALEQHPVKGTASSVNVVDETKKSLVINKIENFSNYHNFQYEASGLRVWRSYGIGHGKLIPYDKVIVEQQGSTMLQTLEEKGFCKSSEKRLMRPVSQTEKLDKEDGSNMSLFECSIPGCVEVFKTFSELELHLDIGKHTQISQYDKIRIDWAAKFSSIDANNGKTRKVATEISNEESSLLNTGWALTKARSSVRFSEKVKKYLTALYMIGERTGKKADPAQVAINMRTSTNASNERQFNRTDWLTKAQIQGFFSRLTAARRKGIVGMSVDEEDDLQCILESSEREELIGSISDEIRVKHPIYYDMYDLCERYHSNKLEEFNVSMLKAICNHFEIQVKSKDKKKDIVSKLAGMIGECECVKK